MTVAWIDMRKLSPEQKGPIVTAAVHSRVDAIVDDTVDALSTLPPTIRRVLFSSVASELERAEECDLDVHVIDGPDGVGVLRTRFRDGERDTVGFVRVSDDRTLTTACSSAVELPYTVVEFVDPTKIPLEIVIAAGDKSKGQLVTQVSDLAEARIVIDVLEKGPEGVLFAPTNANDVFELVQLLSTQTPPLELSTLIVESIEHIGIGDRVCVDTCSQLELDEGILVGSFSSGFVLCCSETHPLPYMETRPFRVNAGALHSYVVVPDNHTKYLSELHSGSPVVAVGSDGRARRVMVGRAKLEARPLLTITAHSANGVAVSLTVQDDWHVRVLGPGGAVLNVTELRSGDELLGYLALDQRHVGIPVEESCLER
jgi:3-amino-4-hydroxybenzoic acid synthase